MQARTDRERQRQPNLCGRPLLTPPPSDQMCVARGLDDTITSQCTAYVTAMCPDVCGCVCVAVCVCRRGGTHWKGAWNDHDQERWTQKARVLLRNSISNAEGGDEYNAAVGDMSVEGDVSVASHATPAPASTVGAPARVDLPEVGSERRPHKKGSGCVACRQLLP